MEVKDSDSDDSEDDSEETHIQKMSAAHKLGLAKVESVKEWLSHVLKPLDDGSVISLRAIQALMWLESHSSSPLLSTKNNQPTRAPQ